MGQKAARTADFTILSAHQSKQNGKAEKVEVGEETGSTTKLSASDMQTVSYDAILRSKLEIFWCKEDFVHKSYDKDKSCTPGEQTYNSNIHLSSLI